MEVARDFLNPLSYWTKSLLVSRVFVNKLKYCELYEGMVYESWSFDIAIRYKEISCFG